MKTTQRLSTAAKTANNYKWYKEIVDSLDNNHGDGIQYNEQDITKHRKLKVNYDLFNSIVDIEEFDYICKPLGPTVGKLPSELIHRDIVSGKIKAVMGMEMKRPFSWHVLSTNPEATTRKETEEGNRIKQYVTSEILKPIRLQIEQQKAEENKGAKLTPEEQQKIQEEIEQELEAQTPESVRKYMKREHQDPSEVMTTQLLNYLIQKKDVANKFNTMLKHSLLSATGVMYVGVLNNEPECWNVNSIHFQSDPNPGLDFIEDGEWAKCDYFMTPSQIITYFGSELKDEEIDRVYAEWSYGGNNTNKEDFFSVINPQDKYSPNFDNGSNAITVSHFTFKGLRKIVFLTYTDDNGEQQEMIVDENYKINIDAGDISVEHEWLPESYETWKIKVNTPIYVKMQPVPGQFKDIDNIRYCKLPYYGAKTDNMNSMETSLMDRLKYYQYLYNILGYRFDLLAATDKGKKVLMNINMIPNSAGMDIKKWQYFMESSPYMWYDPSEEGSGGYNDANTVAKVIDLSYAGQMNQYIEMMEYIRIQCGKSVGITEQVEGAIGVNEKVANVQQSMTQTSHILEPYFELHNTIKKNVLQALIEAAKVAYTNGKQKKLVYFLDDMSTEIINLDMGLLDSSTLNLFLSNSARTDAIKTTIEQLTHAALQNQKVELSDVIAVMRQDSIIEAEEILKVAEEKRETRLQQAQQEQMKAQADEAEKAREFIRETREHEKEIVILKEEEKRETIIVQSSIMGASFNPDQDVDNDGINDFMEIAKYGLDAEVKRQNVQLQKDKFQHQKVVDDKKMQQQDKKLALDKLKLKVK